MGTQKGRTDEGVLGEEVRRGQGKLLEAVPVERQKSAEILF